MGRLVSLRGQKRRGEERNEKKKKINCRGITCAQHQHSIPPILESEMIGRVS